jgi:hypothetical protein
VPPKLTHFESVEEALAFAKPKATSEEFKILEEIGTADRRRRRRA